MKGIAFLPGFIGGLLTWGMILPALSQVTSDSTTDTTINQSGNNFNIVNGIQKGNNLFHSFKEFSIPTGGSAIFNNSTDVINIINRVTGGNISNIDGLIKANGNANLFLINPAGIIFGENARLNIGGSFLGTTAESILFEDGFNYSAIDSQATPLLTISAPIGLQMGTQTGEIINRSQATSNSGDIVGLQVTPGKSISLIGGEINLLGGNITASGGTIEIGSVATGSFVDISPQNQGFNYTNVEKFADINLTQRSIVSATGEEGGRIQVQGKRITLKDNSAIISQTSGNGTGQDLVVRGSEQILFDADAYNPVVRKSLSTDTLPSSTGNGGNIILEAPLIQVNNRAWITSFTKGEGNAGNIAIQANTLEAMASTTDDFSYVRIESGVFPGATGNGGNFKLDAKNIVAKHAVIGTVTAGEGNAGNVMVEVDSLELIGGAQLQTGTFGNGNAGNMVIRASESINIKGVTDYLVLGQFRFSSGLFASTEPNSTGRGGNISVETQQLRITEGGRIAANTTGSGNGGDITIQAKDIQLKNDPVIKLGELPSAIVVSTTTTGNSGNIQIQTERLQVFDGSQVVTSAFGNGEAGNIDILGSSIEVDGIFGDNNFVSRIAALSESDFKAGTINITTNNLTVDNRAEINVSNQGSGDAGNLNVTANNIFLNNEGILQAEVNSGKQGNIELTIIDSLILRNGSSIFANAKGASTGGNININSPAIAGFENSDIVANAIEGNGGNINITTQGIFGLEFREQLTDESDITVSSQFGVNGTVEINNIGADPNSGLVELPIKLTDSSQKVATGCSGNTSSSFVITGRGGMPKNPSQLLNLNSTWLDTRYQSNDVTEITTTTNKPAIVEATGFKRNSKGEIELVALENTPLITKQIGDCSEKSGKNTFSTLSTPLRMNEIYYQL